MADSSRDGGCTQHHSGPSCQVRGTEGGMARQGDPAPGSRIHDGHPLRGKAGQRRPAAVGPGGPSPAGGDLILQPSGPSERHPDGGKGTGVFPRSGPSGAVCLHEHAELCGTQRHGCGIPAKSRFPGRHVRQRSAQESPAPAPQRLLRPHRNRPASSRPVRAYRSHWLSGPQCVQDT